MLIRTDEMLRMEAQTTGALPVYHLCGGDDVNIQVGTGRLHLQTGGSREAGHTGPGPTRYVGRCVSPAGRRCLGVSVTPLFSQVSWEFDIFFIVFIDGMKTD